jgi:hypothetical protein
MDDIQAAMQQVAKAGGALLGEPMEIPSAGDGVYPSQTAVCPGNCRVTGCELDRPPSTAMAWPLT